MIEFKNYWLLAAFSKNLRMIVWIINRQTFRLCGLIQFVGGRDKDLRSYSAFEQAIFNRHSNSELSRIVTAQTVIFG